MLRASGAIDTYENNKNGLVKFLNKANSNPRLLVKLCELKYDMKLIFCNTKKNMYINVEK